MKAAKGIHHITAIAGNPKENLNFYSGILGLRLVKKTVNFDDPSVYHLYYGDEQGRPGTILTFFPWEYSRQGYPDLGQTVAVSFAIPTQSIEFWTTYLDEHGIEIEKPFTRFGKTTIGLQDPDGLHLELVADPAANAIDGWEGGPLPAAHGIRGIHGVTLAEESFMETGKLLTGHLGFTHIEQEHDRHLYKTEAELGAVVEVIDQSGLNGRPGKGTVHHIAFRSADDEEQEDMRRRLINDGYHVTSVKDRRYFHSIYFHEPGGVLFEIATDPPGFEIDEQIENLGSELRLPPWLEDKRGEIEANLTELTPA